MGRFSTRHLVRSLTLWLALATAACRSDAPASDAEPTAGLPDRDPELACAKAREGGVIVDVRTPEEFSGGHVEGAVNIPVDRIDAELDQLAKLTDGDKDKPVVVYCRSGARADRAKSALLRSGYTQVTNVGGLNDWPKDCPTGG